MRRLVWVPLLLWCTACGWFKQEDRFGALPITYEQLSGWQEENHAQAIAAFQATCVIQARKPETKTSISGIRIPRQVWESLCADAERIKGGGDAQARQFFEQRFMPFRITNNGKETGLFTGYYEPVLYGSYKKRGDYIYPLYLSPPDLSSRRPYYTHAEINSGVLAKRNLELVWVDDPVMLFFLQIQGSGRVRLSRDKEILVGYAGQNGHPYLALGKVMGDEGLVPRDQLNFFTLRQWLYDNPGRAFEMMERNPSYVFFKKLDKTGPVGSVGAVLTPMRSLAVDSKYIPYGLPLFLETELPPMHGSREPIPFNRVMIAQDTGGAIRGPVRGDIFFGGGSAAEYLAGYMKGRGSYSLLVPREVADQLQPPE
jgi:membrane-bound lytic murein transglycosylase A